MAIREYHQFLNEEYDVQSVRSPPRFRRKVLPQSSVIQDKKPRTLLSDYSLLVSPEDGVSTFFRNVKLTAT
jgi:hypothetical protein